MTKHYYSRQPEVQSDKKMLTVNLLEHTIKFYTDNGVFSKRNIDFGSQELIRQVKVQPWMTKMIDVGCGYGPLTIALLLDNSQLEGLMLDVNTRALELAVENCRLNHCEQRIHIKENDGLKGIVENSADIIVTNPPIRAGKEVVHAILINAYEVLVENGELWIVIQKKQGMSSAKKVMEATFGNVEVIAKNKGYYILKSKK